MGGTCSKALRQPLLKHVKSLCVKIVQPQTDTRCRYSTAHTACWLSRRPWSSAWRCAALEAVRVPRAARATANATKTPPKRNQNVTKRLTDPARAVPCARGRPPAPGWSLAFRGPARPAAMCSRCRLCLLVVGCCVAVARQRACESGGRAGGCAGGVAGCNAQPRACLQRATPPCVRVRVRVRARAWLNPHSTTGLAVEVSKFFNIQFCKSRESGRVMRCAAGGVGPLPNQSGVV
jgi:hypothetical protein